MDSQELVCQRDGAPTKLRCAQCGAGICPGCLVRTPVGYKCPGCSGDGARRQRRGRRGPAMVAGLAVVALLVGAIVLTRSSGDGAPDRVAIQAPAGEAAPTGQAVIGDEARDGQLVFVVDNATCSAKPAVAAGAGQLCTLRFKVKNTSTSPALFLGRFQYLVDAQAKTYGADDALTRATPDNAGRDVFEINVNPEVVVPLVFVYELPDDVQPIEAQFKGTGRGRLGVNVRLERRA